jgi:hypothetical protein
LSLYHLLSFERQGNSAVDSGDESQIESQSIVCARQRSTTESPRKFCYDRAQATVTPSVAHMLFDRMTELKNPTGFRLDLEHVLTVIVMTARTPQPDQEQSAVIRCTSGRPVELVM